MAISKDTKTGVGICCGSIIILAIIGAIIGNWATISKNVPGILWGTIFFILLVGILVEGWKAVKPDAPNKPDEVISWKNQGNTQFKQGNYDSAISFYNKGLELDPNNLDILYNKALALNKLGKTEEAMKCYEAIRDVKENLTTENIERSPKKEGQESTIQQPVSPLSTPLKDNCRYCGIKLIASSQNFCPGCGMRLAEPTNLPSTFCRNCGAELKYSNAEICPSCGIRIQGPVTPKSKLFGERNPGTAALYSLFIPGLGQIYNGEIGKGIVVLIGTLIGVIFSLIPGIIVWIFGIYEAHKTASKINTGAIQRKTTKIGSLTLFAIIGFILIVFFVIIGTAVLAAFVFGTAGNVSATKSIAVTAQKQDQNIIITNQGGTDIGEVNSFGITVDGITPIKPLGIMVGSTTTIQGTSGSKNRVIVIATFKGGSQQVILDTYV